MIATYKDTVLCSVLWYLNHTLSVRRSWPATDLAYFALHISSVEENCCSYSRYWCFNFTHVICESIYDLCTTDVNIYAHMVNSACEYYDVISAIFDLGKETCNSLPFFYAFTGCDTVSRFFSKGKCRACDAWHQSKQKDVLTNIFLS